MLEQDKGILHRFWDFFSQLFRIVTEVDSLFQQGDISTKKIESCCFCVACFKKCWVHLDLHENIRDVLYFDLEDSG